jgi:hypothetical protein
MSEGMAISSAERERFWIQRLTTVATGEEYEDCQLKAYKLAFARHVITTTNYDSVVAELWPGLRATRPNAPDLSGLAAEIASTNAYLPSDLPEVPVVGQNLVADVAAVCGLTYSDLAELFEVSERAVAAWRATELPESRKRLMEALRSIGLILIAGLGSSGVKRWLQSGEPSRFERIRLGDIATVADEARSYLDSVAS